MNTYTVSEFAKMVGVSVSTLQRWDREGRLVADRTITNRRTYTDHHLAKALGRTPPRSDDREIVGYVRVSSRAQKPDLENQKLALEAYCLEAGYDVTILIEDYGSGLNFKRKGLLRLITMIAAGKVETIIVAHKDRLARFGFELIEFLGQMNGCEIVIFDGEELSPEQEMVQDVLTILHVFSARLYGLRSYQTRIKEALRHG